MRRAAAVGFFAGVAIGTFGIAVTGAAGRIKETGLRQTEYGSTGALEKNFSIRKGLTLSLVAGVLSAVYGFSLNAGQPIADVAARHGAGVWQGNVIYIFSNLGAFITTSIYCIFLHRKNNSARQFLALPAGERAGQLPRNYLWAALTGVLWYGQFFLYNLGHVRMGNYAFTSWALHMTMLVLFSGLSGLILKEWYSAPRLAKGLFGLSIALLVAGVLALTYGNYLGSPTTISQRN